MRVPAGRLAHSPLFAALPEEERAAIVASSIRRPLKKSQRLFARGDRAESLVFVLSGRIDVRRGELVLRSFGPNAVLGLSVALGAPHSADLVAGEASEILLIPGRELTSRPEVLVRAALQLAALVSELSDELEDLLAPTIEERLERRITRLGRGKRELEITHDELARRIGATRANVSRALAKLEDRKVIKRRRGRLEILG